MSNFEKCNNYDLQKIYKINAGTIVRMGGMITVKIATAIDVVLNEGFQVILKKGTKLKDDIGQLILSNDLTVTVLSD